MTKASWADLLEMERALDEAPRRYVPPRPKEREEEQDWALARTQQFSPPEMRRGRRTFQDPPPREHFAANLRSARAASLRALDAASQRMQPVSPQPFSPPGIFGQWPSLHPDRHDVKLEEAEEQAARQALQAQSDLAALSSEFRAVRTEMDLVENEAATRLSEACFAQKDAHALVESLLEERFRSLAALESCEGECAAMKEEQAEQYEHLQHESCEKEYLAMALCHAKKGTFGPWVAEVSAELRSEREVAEAQATKYKTEMEILTTTSKSQQESEKDRIRMLAGKIQARDRDHKALRQAAAEHTRMADRQSRTLRAELAASTKQSEQCTAEQEWRIADLSGRVKSLQRSEQSESRKLAQMKDERMKALQAKDKAERDRKDALWMFAEEMRTERGKWHRELEAERERAQKAEKNTERAVQKAVDATQQVWTTVMREQELEFKQLMAQPAPARRPGWRQTTRSAAQSARRACEICLLEMDQQARQEVRLDCGHDGICLTCCRQWWSRNQQASFAEPPQNPREMEVTCPFCRSMASCSSVIR
jgi:hypothetical protein